jgi:nicotinamide-nucleotide amidase
VLEMNRGVALLAVGDEMLSGLRSDTNCSWLASKLHDAGVPVRGIQVIPDEEDVILETVANWVGKVEFVVLSGGLGPTHDDRTRFALARYLGVPLHPDDSTYDRIVARYEEPFRSRVEASRVPQALIPEGARGLLNMQGSALGIAFSAKGTEVFSFPGVPWEFRAMAEAFFLPRIEERGTWKQVVVAGWPESLLAEKFEGLFSKPGLHVSILPSAGLVTLVFRGNSEEVETAVAQVREELPSDCLENGETEMSAAVVARAAKAGLSLACAESCTGGLVGAAITDVPGASRVFQGTAVCYSNEAKIRLLGVNPKTLENHGAVSEECALEMASGARRLFGSDISVAVTGIAGPEGGTREKPVGTVWFAVSGPKTLKAFKRSLAGDRAHIRRWSTAIALETLWRTLKEG